LISTVATIVLWTSVELGLRLWGDDWMDDADQGLVVERIGAQSASLAWDPRLLWRLPKGTWYGSRGEEIRVNSLGLRGAEVQTPKPAGTLRVLGLGDSVVFGFGVEESESYLAIASKGAGMEPWNGGVPGYSTYQSINVFNMVSSSVQPDVVVVSNIWADLVVHGFQDKELLATHQKIAGHPLWLLNKKIEVFATYRWLRHQVWSRRPPPPSAILTQPGGLNQQGQPRVSLEEYKNNLDTLVEMAADEGAAVVFLVPAVSNDLDKSPHHPDELKTGSYRDVMREVGQNHNALVVEMPSLLRASRLSGTDLFLDGVHLTTRGHAEVAKVLEGALVQAAAARGQ